MSKAYDISIIGGGIFGCATARSLSETTDLDICLIEKEYHAAEHQSGRNSGTLHIGAVTTADVESESQLAEFTLEGTRRLKKFCQEHNLPILNRGIMKVGTNQEEANLVREKFKYAQSTGLDVELLESQEEIHQYEPHIRGSAAFFSPESATVETTAIVQKLAQISNQNGVDFLMGYEVEDLKNSSGSVTIETDKGDIESEFVINTAGSHALTLARKLGLASDVQAIPFRGVYYELIPERRQLVQTNVYPTVVGESFQVGVHFTRRPDHRVIVGPTGMISPGKETYGKFDFDLNEMLNIIKSGNFWKFISSSQRLNTAFTELNKSYRKPAFIKRCQKLIPDLQSDDIVNSFAGINHWLFDEQGERIDEPVIRFTEHSAHLLLPQPGFTSALPIADHIAEEAISRLEYSTDSSPMIINEI